MYHRDELFQEYPYGATVHTNGYGSGGPAVPGRVTYPAEPIAILNDGTMFPSEGRVPDDRVYRPRSQSADPRRQRFRDGRLFSEEHHDDAFPVDNYATQQYPSSQPTIGTPPHIYRNMITEFPVQAAGARSANVIQFPSSANHRITFDRRSPSPPPGPPQQQTTSMFTSTTSTGRSPAFPTSGAPSQGNLLNPAAQFSQHLRERSPASSSALLNLLSRYPSARQSVYREGGSNQPVGAAGDNFSAADSHHPQQHYQAQERQSPTKEFRTRGDRFPIVELAVQHYSSADDPRRSPAAVRRNPNFVPSSTQSINNNGQAPLKYFESVPNQPTEYLQRLRQDFSPEPVRRSVPIAVQPTSQPQPPAGYQWNLHHQQQRSDWPGGGSPGGLDSNRSLGTFTPAAQQKFYTDQQQPQQVSQSFQPIGGGGSQAAVGTATVTGLHPGSSHVVVARALARDVEPPTLPQALASQQQNYPTTTHPSSFLIHNQQQPANNNNNNNLSLLPSQTGATAGRSLLPADWNPNLLDPRELELLLAHAEDEMNRSTSEWRNSFAQMQNRFKQLPPEDVNSGILNSFSSSGAATLPRNALLSKSSSNHEIGSQPTILNVPIHRRSAEAPELRKSGALDSFWNQTVGQRPASPTVQRISASMTSTAPSQLSASERLKMLQEPTDPPRSKTPTPFRLGPSNALEQRKATYLDNSTANNFQPKEYRPRPSTPALRPNFSDLDSAVHELNGAPRATSYSQSARRLGCGRFPTDEHALSPPPPVSRGINRKLNTPSPTDSGSETSSVYQMPTGLPHPKPKHNIKEQLQQAGVQNYYPRSGLRVSPNFPVPTTGSVASRITEFERRPGTPTLQIAGGNRYDEVVVETKKYNGGNGGQNGPMSPRNTVFRTKPVIHVDLGTKSPRLEETTFTFPPEQSTNWADPVVSNLNETPINKFNEYGGVKLQNPPSRTSSQHPSPRSSSGIDFDGHSLNGSVKGAALDTSSGSLSSESSIVNKTVRGRNATRDVLDSIVSSDKVRLVDTLQQSLLDEQYRPAPVRVSTQIPAVRQPPSKKEHVAPWYFPQGKPVPQQQNDNDLRRVSDVFRRLNGHCRFTDMAEVCEAANLPLYWKKPIFEALTKGENRDATQKDFTVWWRAMTSVAHDAAARFVYTVTGGARTHVVAEDLASLVMDVIHTHPGLAFYRSATEFHDKYCDVVITRIFWNVAKTWSGKITTDELRKSDFLDKLFELQKEDDINQSLRYFSYEHFYVVYCKFWDIDTDHDLKISKEDLAYHGDGAIPKVVIDRIFSGAVRRKGGSRKPSEFMDLCDFTRFLLADEDKKHPTSIEYWFRVLDQDGDGIVTLYDLEFFHKALQDKMAEQGIESMSIRDVACLLIDTICPEGVSHFKLSDLKRTSLAPRFLNSLVNWRKFYSQETNECSDSARIEDESGQELTDWDRFCIEEYEVMMEQDGDDVDENFTVTLDDDDAKLNGTIYLNGDDESHRSFHDIL